MSPRPCIVDGCDRPASWTCETPSSHFGCDPTLDDYCEEHATEWLLAEKATRPQKVAS